MTRSGRATLLLLPAILACGVEKPATPHAPVAVVIDMADGTLFAPDSVPAGTVRIRMVRRDSTEHNLVVYALNGADPASFAAALGSVPSTPAPALALGGTEGPVEPGDTSEVILTLAPGQYLLGCMSRAFAQQRHVSAGEWKVLTVVAGTSEAPPAATIEVGLTDFAFQAEPRWPAGDQVIKVENIGTQEHILLLFRLDEGHTLGEWARVEGDAPWSHPLGGISRLGPGQSVLLPLDLEPGRHVLICLYLDPATGRPHTELGMMREVVVERAS